MWNARKCNQGFFWSVRSCSFVCGVSDLLFVLVMKPHCAASCAGQESWLVLRCVGHAGWLVCHFKQLGQKVTHMCDWNTMAAQLLSAPDELSLMFVSRKPLVKTISIILFPFFNEKPLLCWQTSHSLMMHMSPWRFPSNRKKNYLQLGSSACKWQITSNTFD